MEDFINLNDPNNDSANYTSQANNELISHENLFTTFFENSPIGKVILDYNDLKFLNVNKSFCNIIGYSESELYSMNLLEIYYKENSISDDILKKRIKSYAESNYEAQRRYQKKDGTEVWVKVTSSLIYNNNHIPIYITGIIDNITEQVYIQKKLIKSEKLFRLLAENSQDMIFRIIFYPETKYEYISPSATNITGYTPEEHYADPSISLRMIHPDDFILYESYLKNPSAFNNKNLIIRWIKKDASLIWTEQSIVPILDDKEQLIALEGVVRDITERKLNEQFQLGINKMLELISIGENLIEIMNNLAKMIELQKEDLRCSIIKIENNGRKGIVLAAPSLKNELSIFYKNLDLSAETTGSGAAYHKKEIIVVEDIFNSSLYYNIKNRLINLNIKSLITLPIINNNNVVKGIVNFYWSNSHKPDQSDLHFIEVTAHIAGIAIERKEIEQLFIKSKEQMELLKNAKSEFLSNIGNYIRTPLNSILGFSELLKNTISSNSKEKSYLDGIVNSSVILLKLFNDIVDLTKIEEGQLIIKNSSVDIYAICQEIKATFQDKLYDKSLNFIIDFNIYIPKQLFLDEVRIRQVLFSLIDNSIKFTEKGSITLKVDQITNNNNLDLLISIIDTGIGISEDKYEAIFEPFRYGYQHSFRKYGGSGLGLIIAKRLVELMNGEISVNSELGVGTCFNIILKDVTILPNKNTINNDNDFTITNFDFNNSCVLIVDDISSNRDLIKSYLDPFNLNIIEAENALEAIKFSNSYKIDLIFMNMQISEMNEIDTAKILKTQEKEKNIPIILLVDTAFRKSIDEFVTNFDSYIIKPVTRKLLLDELKKFLPFNAKIINSYEATKNNKTDNIINPAEKTSVNLSKDIYNYIYNDLIPEWTGIQNNLIIQEIKDFAENIIYFGNKNNIHLFTSYGNELLKQLDMLNIQKIIKLLPQFPQIVELLTKSE